MYALTSPRNLIDEFFRDFDRPSTPEVATFRPSVDVVQVEGGFVLRAELPGVAKEAVKIEVKEQILMISGEKPAPSYESKGYRYSEIGYGKFERTFHLSESIDLNRVEAKFETGILEIKLSLKPELGPRQVTIA